VSCVGFLNSRNATKDRPMDEKRQQHAQNAVDPATGSPTVAVGARPRAAKPSGADRPPRLGEIWSRRAISLATSLPPPWPASKLAGAGLGKS